MKILAITQVRYGSTRLPAKVLKTVGGKTLLEIHLERILQSKRITKLIVATTNEDGIEHIIDIVKKKNVDFFQGSIDDVLSRFYHAAKPEFPDYIVRITSDCPLVDPVIIDKVIDECVTSDFDYVSNTMNPTYPDGIDVEVFRFSALEQAFNEASLKSDREHVTPYIWRNSSYKGGSIFKSNNIENSIDYSSYRITVDTDEDFQVIKYLIENLGISKSWIEYVNFLDENKKIKNINQQYKRNEGYTKSLLND
jgi:spore coat polysaccharide biosynthesis protein SpsF (cytidylyltransferase family)